MNREGFNKKVKTAIGDGSKARAELARAQAKAFLAGSTDFNPKVLQRLGGRGLRQFLRLINLEELETGLPTHVTNNQDVTPPLTNVKDLTWAQQRRSEPMWKLRSVLYGTTTGLTLLLGTINILNLIDFWS